MIQPLNYSTKAIGELIGLSATDSRLSRAGLRYLVAKLRQAQVFLLTDGGELLDRSKARPDVPGIMLRPPFPVVALEYPLTREGPADPFYLADPASKRISLAWDWQNDLPRELAAVVPPLPPGVAIASIFFSDEQKTWFPVSAAAHIAYDDARPANAGHRPDYAAAMLAIGRVTKASLSGPALAGSFIPLLPEAIELGASKYGVEAMLDSLAADLDDEVNAYFDLCCALACNNVSTEHHTNPARLNKARIRKGKLPLKDFHVLKLAGGNAMPGAGDGGGDRSSPRSHLRRGHIRRLSAERVTWVNSTIVKGRGFIDKVYAA